VQRAAPHGRHVGARSGRTGHRTASQELDIARPAAAARAANVDALTKRRPSVLDHARTAEAPWAWRSVARKRRKHRDRPLDDNTTIQDVIVSVIADNIRTTVD
jgi:hypothetical protein